MSRIVSVSALAVIVTSLAVGPVGPALASVPQTVSFGNGDVWTVPSGVTSVYLEISGGDGGTATNLNGDAVIGQGGRGGVVTGTLAVSEGDQLEFRVASGGSSYDFSSLGGSLTGPTGFHSGGGGWATGGASTGVVLNGTLVAGAPGGGAGAAIWYTTGIVAFVSDGGNGGSNAPDVVDGSTLLLAGGVAGASTDPTPNNGQYANLSVQGGAPSPSVIVIEGAGGAGWPGGAAGGGSFALPNVYAAGGGGGLPFVGAELKNTTVGVKASTAPRDGTATVTFTAPAQLAATGSADLTIAALAAALLVAAGGAALALRRRTAV